MTQTNTYQEIPQDFYVSVSLYSSAELQQSIAITLLDLADMNTIINTDRGLINGVV